MSLNRFYIPPSEWRRDALTLKGSEAQHCLEVLRHQAGDRLVVFNGQGEDAFCEIDRVEKREVILKTLSTNRSAPLEAQITLAQAIPKGKNMELILQKATELGAARIVPIQSSRAVVRLEGEAAEKKAEKWRRVVIEACKQCGQNWLPEIAPVQTLEDFSKELEGARSPSTLLLLASLQPGAQGLKSLLAERALGDLPSQAIVLIGPEGDFTPAETAIAIRSGCQALSLGPIVLRTETAAIYTLSILGHELMPGLKPVELTA